MLTMLGNISLSFKEKLYPMKLGCQSRNLIVFKIFRV